MTLILILILCILFILIAGIHFYWFLGGKFGYEKVIPKNEKGEWLFTPKKPESLIVTICFLFFTIIYMTKAGFISLILYTWILDYGGWFIIIIFFIRAIGDFKYVGFFKSIKSTDFAILDNKFYSPLCFIIATISLIIELVL